MQPLVDMAADMECAILGITHFSKGGKDTDPAQRVVLSALDQTLPIRGFAFLDPGLTELRVLEGLDRRCRTGLLAHRAFPGGGDVPPAAPPDRAVQRGQVKPSGPAVARCGRPPLAVFEHPRLVGLGNRGVAGLADVRRRVGLPALPAQLLEAQPLPVRAVRTRHEVPALVARVVLALDGARARDRRRRDDEDLAARESARARLGQRDCVAFALDVQWVAVHLVEEQVAHRH